MNFSQIKKINADEQIVYGEVYAPNVMDTHGDFMTAETIVEMAHRFMADVDLHKSIDIMHNEVATESYPVESFVARKNDPDFTEGAWVLGVKIPDETIWKAVKSGVINGFSFQALAKTTPVVVEVEMQTEIIKTTEQADDGHVHYYFVKLDDDGRVQAGRTSITNGHSHSITKGTATDNEAEHSHRIFI